MTQEDRKAAGIVHALLEVCATEVEKITNNLSEEVVFADWLEVVDNIKRTSKRIKQLTSGPN